jgi:hypothetical protein
MFQPARFVNSFSEPYSYKEQRDLVKICTLSSPVLYQITFSNSFPHSLSFISLPSLRPPSRRDITLDAFHAHSPSLQSDPFSKAREDLVLCLTLSYGLGGSTAQRLDIFTVIIYFTGMEAARGDTHGSTIVTPAYIPVLDTSGRVLSLHRIVNRVRKGILVRLLCT